MEKLLLENFRKYPKMQITDAVKLIYQNEFGCGHMIVHPAQSLALLHKEREFAQKEELPATEEIGNGLCRLNLRAESVMILDDEAINDYFVRTSREVEGTILSFEEKLGEMVALSRKDRIPIPTDPLLKYIEVYKKAGYPPVSHSEQYRAAYRPSYRVMKSEYARLLTQGE